MVWRALLYQRSGKSVCNKKRPVTGQTVSRRILHEGTVSVSGREVTVPRVQIKSGMKITSDFNVMANTVVITEKSSHTLVGKWGLTAVWSKKKRVESRGPQ